MRGIGGQQGIPYGSVPDSAREIAHPPLAIIRPDGSTAVTVSSVDQLDSLSFYFIQALADATAAASSGGRFTPVSLPVSLI